MKTNSRFVMRDGLSGRAFINKDDNVVVIFDRHTGEPPKTYSLGLAVSLGIMGELFGDDESVACSYCDTVNPVDKLQDGMCKTCNEKRDEGELVECDDCHAIKPSDQFSSPGHLSGGQYNGFDIDSCVCTACGQKAEDAWHKQMDADIEREMAEESCAMPCEPARIRYG